MGNARLHGFAVPVYFSILEASRGCWTSSQACAGNTTLPSRGSSLLAVNVERIRTLGGGFPHKIKTKTGGKSRIGSVAGEHRGAIWSNTNETLLPCGASVFAPGGNRCPGECAYSSLDPKQACHWRCVKAEECGQDDPSQNIADPDYKVCRGCVVVGCRTCVPGHDTCTACKAGYSLIRGVCQSRGRHVWTVLFSIVGFLVVVLLSWYISIICGQLADPLVLKQAVVHRARAALRDRKGGQDSWFPLFSNLWRLPSTNEMPIGGPGLMLLFSFQLALIIWISFIITGWIIAAWYLGLDMLVVGTYDVIDAQDMCQAVRWGRRVRDRLRWGKLIFTATLYFISTFLAIAFSVWQFRRFQEVDSKTSTMMDYAAVCIGFPPDNGKNVEEDIQAFILNATGCRTVGVSVCWDYSDVEAKVLTLVTNEVRRREQRCENEPACVAHHSTARGRGLQLDRPLTLRTTLAGQVNCLFGPFFRLIDTLLGIPASEDEDFGGNDEMERDVDEKMAEQLFKEIHASGTAFVVFQTERDRDATIRALAAPMAPLYKGRHVIRATREFYEPQAVFWSNFAVSPSQIVKRMCLGVLGTLVAIVIWGVCFYAPYAYFEADTFVTTGEPPGFISDFTFSMLVVIGNQIMYFLCSAIAERVGFRSRDHAQEAYVLLYTGAVLVNTVVDIAIIVYTTYVNMVARRVRTDDGQLLRELLNSTAVFESYPMMKVFGRTLYEYNQSCFLLPFVMEAALTVALPYHLGYRLVRARKLARHDAESCLHPIMMDLSRYGDLIVNATLVATSFFTASGWVLKTCGWLLIGNTFVFCFDQFRVLRHVENFYMASGDVDSAVQRLMSLPCAVLAAACIFQLHGMFPDRGPLAGQNLWILLIETFMLHILIHMVVLGWAVKHLGKIEHVATQTPYSEAAKDWPGNWFTSNPVHCLRSLFLHKHATPCVYYIRGKEAYLEFDEAHGMHFKPRRQNPTEAM